MNETKSQKSKTIVYKLKPQTKPRTKTATHPAASAASVMLRHIPIFPIRKFVKGMLYHDGFAVTSGVGTMGGYVFSANGIYDPNISGTGHQPMGFDQMMLFYEQYAVVAATVQITAVATTSNISTSLVAYLSPDTTIQTSLTKVLENGLAVFKVLDPYIYGTKCQQTLNLNCDCVKYFGHKDKDALVADPQLVGDSANNPGEQVYFTIAHVDFAQGVASTVNYNVIISYDVIFWEPRKLASS